ncbi:MAG: MoaD/ThiS family protein [Symploca sp. SIO2G7]|nr:MoaD/ThiS family protein [Symploca sp. SIO2G7]
MTVTVKFPTPLQKFTNNQKEITSSGSNITELLDSLESSCPGLKKRLYNGDGDKLNRFLLFYVNDEDIRFLDGTNTPLKDGDEVSIISAVAGG